MQRQTLQRQEPIGLLIGAARRSIKQAVGARASRYRLSPQQFWLLVTLDENEGLSLSELATHLRMGPPTASRVVAALARRKLVRIEPDPNDRRRSHLLLTATGNGLARELHGPATEVRESVHRGLSASERETLRTLLRKVISNLDDLELENADGRDAPQPPRGRKRLASKGAGLRRPLGPTLAGNV